MDCAIVNIDVEIGNNKTFELSDQMSISMKLNIFIYVNTCPFQHEILHGFLHTGGDGSGYTGV